MTAPTSPPTDDGAASIGVDPTAKKMGRPKLPAAPAERVRDVLHTLLAENFDGNKAALARAIGRSPTAVNDLLEARANPSFDTVCKIARMAGCTEGDLLFGDRPIVPQVNETTDPYPNLTNVLRRLEGLVSPELVRLLHQHIPVGAVDLSEQRWFDTLVALKIAQTLGTLVPWPKEKGE